MKLVQELMALNEASKRSFASTLNIADMTSDDLLKACDNAGIAFSSKDFALAKSGYFKFVGGKSGRFEFIMGFNNEEVEDEEDVTDKFYVSRFRVEFDKNGLVIAEPDPMPEHEGPDLKNIKAYIESAKVSLG